MFPSAVASSSWHLCSWWGSISVVHVGKRRPTWTIQSYRSSPMVHNPQGLGLRSLKTKALQLLFGGYYVGCIVISGSRSFELE